MNTKIHHAVTNLANAITAASSIEWSSKFMPGAVPDAITNAERYIGLALTEIAKYRAELATKGAA